MSDATDIGPREGTTVLHLFAKVTPLADAEAASMAVKGIESAGDSVVCIATLGHKADVAFMLLGGDPMALRSHQTALAGAGLEIVDSYLSITEVNEYAQGLPEQMKQDRLHPQLPPEGKQAWCFYPMSKRRADKFNWYELPFDERRDLMMEHGKSGRAFAGRVIQLITSSTGLDDYEWGVTLFAQRIDDLKDVVYTLRFDEASARYAEFGPFYTGVVGSPADVLRSVGVE